MKEVFLELLKTWEWPHTITILCICATIIIIIMIKRLQESSHEELPFFVKLTYFIIFLFIIGYWVFAWLIPELEGYNSINKLFETTMKYINFAIIYVSLLFAIMGILSVWGIREIHRIHYVRKDLEDFKDKLNEYFSVGANLANAKIFYNQRDFLAAWEYIEDLPDINYEIPLYKAIISMYLKKNNFSDIDTLLDRALSFPNLTKRARAIIYRYKAANWLKLGRNPKKALIYANKAIREDEKYVDGYIAKILALRRILGDDKLQRIIEKLEHLKKTYGSEHPIVYYNLACYYSKISNIKEAKNNLKKYLKLIKDPTPGIYYDPDLENLRKKINIEDLRKESEKESYLERVSIPIK